MYMINMWLLITIGIVLVGEKDSNAMDSFSQTLEQVKLSTKVRVAMDNLEDRFLERDRADIEGNASTQAAIMLKSTAILNECLAELESDLEQNSAYHEHGQADQQINKVISDVSTILQAHMMHTQQKIQRSKETTIQGIALANEQIKRTWNVSEPNANSDQSNNQGLN